SLLSRALTPLCHSHSAGESRNGSCAGISNAGGAVGRVLHAVTSNAQTISRTSPLTISSFLSARPVPCHRRSPQSAGTHPAAGIHAPPGNHGHWHGCHLHPSRPC